MVIDTTSVLSRQMSLRNCMDVSRSLYESLKSLVVVPSKEPLFASVRDMDRQKERRLTHPYNYYFVRLWDKSIGIYRLPDNFYTVGCFNCVVMHEMELKSFSEFMVEFSKYGHYESIEAILPFFKRCVASVFFAKSQSLISYLQESE